MKFNIGDKVKRTDDYYNNMCPGDTDTVVGTGGHKLNVTLDLKKYGYGHASRKFIRINTSWKDRMTSGQ